MASYVPTSGKWPDPRKDSLIYVLNPIEAELPGHWVPESVIKKHIENRVGDRVQFSYTTKRFKPTGHKIRLVAKLKVQPKNKHKALNTDSEENQNLQQHLKGNVDASNILPSDEDDTPIEASDESDKLNKKTNKAREHKPQNKHKLSFPTEASKTQTMKGKYPLLLKTAHTKRPIKPSHTTQKKALNSPQAKTSNPVQKKVPSPQTKASNSPIIEPKLPQTKPLNPPTKPTEPPTEPLTEPPTEPPTQPPTEPPTETTKTTVITTTPTGDPFY